MRIVVNACRKLGLLYRGQFARVLPETIFLTDAPKTDLLAGAGTIDCGPEQPATRVDLLKLRSMCVAGFYFWRAGQEERARPDQWGGTAKRPLHHDKKRQMKNGRNETSEVLLDVFSKKRVMERGSAWSDRGQRGVWTEIGAIWVVQRRQIHVQTLPDRCSWATTGDRLKWIRN